MNARKILFIAWDAPHTRYMEGLFVPIFERLSAVHPYEFHVMQFSWANNEQVAHLREVCQKKNIHYTHVPVTMKPLPMIGKYLTLLRGPALIRRYILDHGIDIVMPRSTMPAKMMLSVKNTGRPVRIAFDADGLPIEERVDFAGLKKGSMRYRALKRIEKKILVTSDHVLTRTRRAIELLRDQHGIDEAKFFVVSNGRDSSQFRRQDAGVVDDIRKKLGIPVDALVLAYCGSLGPQYGIGEMLYIQRNLISRGHNSYLLLIVTNPGYLKSDTLAGVPNVIVTQVPFQQVPIYLSCADVGLAIRQPSLSMRGVAPVKLGEYLLMGLPTVASADIGDTEMLFSGKDFVFLLADHRHENLEKAIDWLVRVGSTKGLGGEARRYGEEYFGLDASVNSYHHALNGL